MSRSIQLIEQFLGVQANILRLYKNSSKIQGQYNLSIKTVSIILAALTEKKMAFYESLLFCAAEKDSDISLAGFDSISFLLSDRKEHINSKSFVDRETIIKNAIEHSMNLTNIITSALEVIASDNIERPHIRESLNQMMDSEIKDQRVLKSFIRTQPNNNI
ncbi:MAG: hypothetical protein PF505_01300 [Vallitaleaceae bacterium]|jgi:hypothetical protein|nr:hypothetical protein [Vallitaleaceae bacterium]